jgi:hypothetical protein
MTRPPLPPSSRLDTDEPTWQTVLATYGWLAGLFALILVASYPVASLLLGAVAGAAWKGGPVAVAVVRCLATCRRITLSVGDRFRITISRPPYDDPC